jgi:hypothetical protein
MAAGDIIRDDDSGEDSAVVLVNRTAGGQVKAALVVTRRDVNDPTADPLPTGASTSLKQDTGNTSLANIDGKLPASLGGKTAALSLSTTLATDEPLIGIKTETAPASDTASSGINGRLQRIAQNITTNTTTALPAGSAVIGRTGWDFGGVAGVALADNADAVAVSATINGAKAQSRNTVFNGTSWDRQRGDTNGMAVQSALTANFWNYATPTGGIVNTATAVTIKAAGGASVRNFLKTLTLSHDALGAATEIAIRDGAAGTVLWRGKLQVTAVEDATITFDPPLKGTANTLMEVVVLTAVTGGVFVNATGYTGA